MTPEDREHRDQTITEFRYQLVAELANPYLSATKRRELIRQKGADPTRRAVPRSAALFGGLHPQVAVPVPQARSSGLGAKAAA